jgi:uncharacterized YceG family protein
VTAGPPESDEFGRTDPEAIERERRRREREERRSQQQPAQQPPTEQQPAQPQAARQPEANPPPRKPRGRPSMPRRPRRRTGTGSGHPNGPRIALLAVAALFLVFLFLLFQPFHGDGSGKVLVTIPKGASAGEIADILDDRGVITSGTLFQMRLRLSGKTGDVQAGTYTLANGMSYGSAIDALTSTKRVTTLNVVVPEGYSRQQIAAVAKDAGVEGDYMKASLSSPLLNPKQYGAKHATSLEGFLFPATYMLKPGSDADALVDQQLNAFKENIKGVDMSYAKKKNLTTYDVLTIASMVEREVQVAKERALVAAVIYNRLHQHMPLGIDATTRFAVGNYDKPLTQSELNSDSPYNTRKVAGLPPGPIGNPGLAAIKAAAHPAKVGYLFYVVKPGTCGELAFAKTLPEFNKLVAEYNKARDAAGGKSPTSCPSG